MGTGQIRGKLMTFIRSGHAVEMLINLVGPFLVYTLAEPSLGRVHALMASAIPPIVWSLVELVRKRRLDALSMIVLGGIALSLLAFFGGGGYRMLQLREHLVSAVLALVFLGSSVIKRPLIVVVARAVVKRRSHEKAEKLKQALKDERKLRMLNYVNLVIGYFLLLQVIIAVILLFTLPIKEFLVVSPIINYVFLGLLLAGAVLFKKYRERKASAKDEYARYESS